MANGNEGKPPTTKLQFDQMFGPPQGGDEFSAAMSRYLDSTDPVGPRPQVHYPVFGSPFKPGAGPLNALIGPVDAFMSELLGQKITLPVMTPKGVGLFGVDAPAMSLTTSETTPGVGKPIDVTDPAVDVRGVDMTPFERHLRHMRYVGRSINIGLTGGAGLAVGAASEQAEQLGEIAPPSTEDEEKIGSISGMLGWLMHGGSFGETNDAVAKHSGQLGAGLIPFLAAGGATAGVEAATLPLAGRLAADAGIGAAAGYAEGKARQALGNENANPALDAFEFGGVGLGLGGLLHVAFPANTARASSRIVDMLEESGTQVTSPTGIAPGLEIDGVKSVMVKGQIRYRGPKGFVKLSEDQKRSFELASADKAQRLVSSSPEVQAVEQAAEKADPATLASYPSDLRTPENFQTINTVAALYRDHAVQKIRVLGETRVKREVNELKKLFFDSTLPEGERLTAAARAYALEHEAKLSTGTIPGMLPLDIELAAAQLVRRVLPLEGLKRLDVIADEAAVNGQPEFGARVKQIARAKGLPEAYHTAVQDRLDKISKSEGKGISKGIRGIFEGRPVEVAEKPKYGMAFAKTLDDKPEVVLVKSEGFVPFPKAGKYVKLTDGNTVRVVASNPGKMRFSAEDAEGNVEWHELKDITDMHGKKNEAIVAKVIREIPGDDVQQVPPVKAVTSEGEQVTVTGVGSEAAEVKTKDGRTKRVRKESVKASTANKPEAIISPALAAHNEIRVAGGLKPLVEEPKSFAAVEIPVNPEVVEMAPGTIPDKGHKILYTEIPNASADQFKKEIETGKLSQELLTSLWGSKKGIVAHVLPNRNPETQLFAVEVPAEQLPLKHYSKEAKAALDGLGGTAKIENHSSSVSVPKASLKDARFYHVPDALRDNAIQSNDALKGMSQEEQTKYLRNLSALNENIPTEVAQPVAKVVKARTRAKKAAQIGDVKGYTDAKKEESQNIIEAAEAQTKVAEEKVPAQTAEMPPAQQAFEDVGLTPETQEYYNTVLDGLTANNPMSSLIAVGPDTRAFITKVEEPFMRRELGGKIVPDVNEVYEVNHFDSTGEHLEAATRKFTDPVELGTYLKRVGYEPTNLQSFEGGEWVHRENPKIAAKIVPVRGSGKVNLVRSRTKISGPEGAGASAEAPTGSEMDAAEKMFFQVAKGEVVAEDASGQRLFHETERGKVFNTSVEAEQALGPEFERMDPEETLTDRFRRLPELKQDTPAAVVGQHGSELKQIIEQASKHQPLPPAFKEAASRFVDYYTERFGNAPWSKNIRQLIGRPTVEDIGPAGYGGALGRLADENIGEGEQLARAGEWDAGVVRAGYNKIRVGSRASDIGKAMKKVIDQLSIGTNVPETRAKLIEQAEKLANISTEYKPQTGEVPKEVVDIAKKLKRQAQLLEKLAMGQYPSERRDPMTGVSEQDLLPASEEMMRALGTMRRGPISEGLGRGEDHFHLPRSYAYTPKDILQQYGGLVIEPGTPESTIGREAKAISDALADQTQFTKSYLLAQDQISTTPAQFSPSKKAVALYRPSGEVVEITGHISEVGSEEATVRFPGTGEEMQVAKSDLELAHDKMTTPFKADVENDGKWGEFLNREPAAGYGAIEQKLGVFGERSPSVLGEAFGARAEELRAGMTLQDGALVGSKEDMQELMALYTRSQWLDKVETVPGEFRVESAPSSERTIGVTKGGVPVVDEAGVQIQKPVSNVRAAVQGRKTDYQRPGTQLISSVVEDAVTQGDTKLAEAFHQAAYQYMKEQLGTSPYSELVSQAFAGILEPQQEEILRGWGAELGLKSVPLAKIASEIWYRQLLDPISSRYAIQLRNELGFLSWPGLATADVGAITLKTTRPNDLSMLTSALQAGWKVMRKHPLTRMVSDAIYYARDTEMKKIADVRILLRDLEEQGLKFEDRKVIRRMFFDAQEHDWNTFDEIKENTDLKGMTEERWSQYQYGYSKLKDHFQNQLDDVAREFLYRRVKPIEFDPTNPEHIELADQLGIPRDKLAKGAMLLPRTPQFMTKGGVLDLHGEQPSGWGHDEIEAFISMMRKYKDASELPNLPPPGVNIKRYQEMEEYFDVWKHYGINNYWPLVHEGNIAINNSKGELMGWAQSMMDAIDATKQLRKSGRLSADEPIEIRMQGSQVADDILVRTIHSKSDWNAVAQAMGDQMKQDGEDIRALLVSTDKNSEYLRNPSNVHGQVRKAKLMPVFEDPDRELYVYSARVARMGYRRELISALRLLQDQGLDRALSDAHKVSRLVDMPSLNKYARDQIAKAAGEQGVVERAADNMMQFWNFLTTAPKEIVSGYFTGQKIYGLGDWKLYNERYATRAAASKILKFQSLWRLSLSPASALANATQVMVTTFPKLIGPKVNEFQAAKISFEAQWIDGIKIFQAWRKGYRPEGELGLMWDIVDAAGVDLTPSKQMAGSGRSFSDLFGGAPVKGESTSEYLLNWSNYKAMWMFNGAEKLNRYGTAIASVKRDVLTLGKPLASFTQDEIGQSVQRARNLVRETQFLYDDLSIPKALSIGGPVGRVLFQFKPYIANILSYETDLISDAIAGKPYAKRQLLAHVGTLGVLGGLTGVLYHPALATAGGMAKLATGKDIIDIWGHQIPLTADGVKLAQNRRRLEDATPEENFMGTTHFRADDLLYYGLPGLVGLSMGQRVGISGQELVNEFSLNNAVGPYGSMYLETGKAWAKYLSGRGSGLGGAAGVIGGLAGAAFGPSKTLPFVAPLAGSATAALATAASSRPFGQYFWYGPEGQAMYNAIVPTAIRNGGKALDLFNHGVIKDVQGRPMHIPAENHVEESLYGAVGLPTIRKDEYSAVIGFMEGQASEAATTRQDFVNQIARKWAAGDFKGAYQSIYNAQQLGLEIPESSIQREFDAITEERMTTMKKSLPQGAREIP